jgi:hypothetical protein
MVKTGDSKVTVRESAEKLMTLILSEFVDDKLLPVILKLTEHQTLKIKMDCIEILIQKIPKCKEFFHIHKSKTISNFIFLDLKEFISKISSFIRERKNTSSFTQCLILLYQNYKESFHVVLGECLLEDQEMILKILQPHMVKNEHKPIERLPETPVKKVVQKAFSPAPVGSPKFVSPISNHFQDFDSLPTIKKLILRESFIQKDLDYSEFQKKVMDDSDIHSLLNQIVLDQQLSDIQLLNKLCNEGKGDWENNAEYAEKVAMDLIAAPQEEIRSQGFSLIESIIKNYSFIFVKQSELLKVLVKGNEDVDFKVSDNARNACKAFIDHFPNASDVNYLFFLILDFNFKFSGWI